MMQRTSHYPSHPSPVEIPLTVLPEHECSYLTGRRAQTRAFMVGKMPGDMYHAFMNAGFRRSGKLVYQPVCLGCRECISVRVPVETFQPSKSQRRCSRRNADLTITASIPTATQEKFELYRRYCTLWHGKKSDDADEWESFETFLYDSPVETVEFSYRDPGGRLLAVGICDICSQSLSSVYFYHEPTESRRGLGTFGALREIEFSRIRGIPYYYLGYWVQGCGTMQYKANFRPFEALFPDGVWRTIDH
jgi:arginyl-tRNA--protein-N-Asp/Glu arginylyltransferase